MKCFSRTLSIRVLSDFQARSTAEDVIIDMNPSLALYVLLNTSQVPVDAHHQSATNRVVKWCWAEKAGFGSGGVVNLRVPQIFFKDVLLRPFFTTPR